MDLILFSRLSVCTRTNRSVFEISLSNLAHAFSTKEATHLSELSISEHYSLYGKLFNFYLTRYLHEIWNESLSKIIMESLRKLYRTNHYSLLLSYKLNVPNQIIFICEGYYSIGATEVNVFSCLLVYLRQWGLLNKSVTFWNCNTTLRLSTNSCPYTTWLAPCV